MILVWHGIDFDCRLAVDALTIVQTLAWIDELPETFPGDDR